MKTLEKSKFQLAGNIAVNVKAHLHGTTLSHATKSYRVNRPLHHPRP